MQKVSIRVPKIKELSRVSYITQIAYKSPFRPGGRVTKAHVSNTLVQDIKDKKVGILVAVVDGKIIGAAKFKDFKPNELYLYQLAVLKKYRGKKIGTLLMQAIEKIAKRKKYRKLVLDCMQEKELVPYYESKGFKVYKIEEKNDYHLVWMSKKI